MLLVKDWIYIAGPCAAETEEQVMETAQAVKNHVSRLSEQTIFRAGIWKPRTQPNTFQGIGDEGLKWLQRVQKEIGLAVATEVATPDQVNAAIQAGIDYLWIGARTSANPIAVQEIANAIKANNHPLKGVFIKNPVNNDTALWLGNIERIEATQTPVAAIHRGCEHQPCWEMAYKLHKQRPDIPLILDPSHMSGDAQKIEGLCHDANELEYDGVMVEVHPHPTEALSDKQQQIPPELLGHIMQNIKRPMHNSQVELKWFRHMIDEVDDRLWETLRERMRISHQIGEWKKQNGMDIVQPTRYQEILIKRKLWAKEMGLNEDTVESIFREIHKESIKMQQ